MGCAHLDLQLGQLSNVYAEEIQTWWNAYQADSFYMFTPVKHWSLKCGSKDQGNLSSLIAR